MIPVVSPSYNVGNSCATHPLRLHFALTLRMLLLSRRTLPSRPLPSTTILAPPQEGRFRSVGTGAPRWVTRFLDVKIDAEVRLFSMSPEVKVFKGFPLLIIISTGEVGWVTERDDNGRWRRGWKGRAVPEVFFYGFELRVPDGKHAVVSEAAEGFESGLGKQTRGMRS